MVKALHDALTGIIDYAGLFPPARLSMEDAVSAYAAHVAGPERWMIDRFLCPAARLEELAHVLEATRLARCPVSVIGSGATDLDAWESALEVDAKAMTTFENRLDERAPIESLETRRPLGDLGRIVEDLRAFDRIAVYLELPLDDQLEDALAHVAESDWLGAKARTGGVEASAFPDCLALARFLKGSQDLEVEFKLTAGLHHPLRTYDPELEVKHHGFLNVLAALGQNAGAALSTAEMEAVLAISRLEELPLDRLNLAREFFRGFGSCSVREPLEGLEQLGLPMEVLI